MDQYCVTCLIILYVCSFHFVSPQMTGFMRFLDNIHRRIYRYPNEGRIHDTNDFASEYDFVIIGAGSGGSVVANRLTEISEWNVLLLEAGDDEPFFSEVPLAAPANSITSLNWGYKTDPVKGACLSHKNHRCNWPRGKVLGGTSVLNFMVYTRGNRADYDEWETLGNRGWAYNDVLPYFKKSENVQIKKLMKSKYHGINGYLNVEESSFTSTFFDHFKTAAKELGYDFNDPNGKKHIGFSRVQANIRSGRRCSASKAFLEPIRHRKNLHISKLSRVTKILINVETKKVTGVEFIKENQVRVVRVGKEVILSAGTISSAHLLMLSGIGPKENLENFNIPVIKDSKVGYNLQDHVCYMGVMYILNQTSNFLSMVRTPRAVIDYLFYSKGPFTIPGGAEGIAFLKTKYTNTSDDVPDVELVMGVASANEGSTMMQAEFVGGSADYYQKLYKNSTGLPTVTIVPILLSPKSRGRISLKSANPFDWPSLQPNYFHDERDIHVLREAAKKTIEIMQTSGFQKMGARLYDTKYPGCENFELMSDNHWECAIRQTTTTVSHLVGTARMGPASDPQSVVDPALKVIGVSGLRVVDASIMPTIPRGHTNAVVYMIGEKASDMIKTEWLKKDTKNNTIL